MEITEEILNTASKNLLDQLPDGVGSLVEAMSRERSCPLWHCTCGILLEVHTEGRLSAMTIDPSWKQGFKQKTLTCAQCNKSFTPTRLNQVYCSTNCGEIAEYTKRLAKLPIPAKPKNTKNMQQMEDYLAEVRHRDEIKEIIQLLTAKNEPEVVEVKNKPNVGNTKNNPKSSGKPSVSNVDSGVDNTSVEARA